MKAVTGVVQHYPWGDPDFIPRLLGQQPDGRPWAELWLGTHRNGPTRLDDGTTLESRTGQLSYLLKVLSANAPLSLQTHPNRVQAIDGYARGVYADDQAKPELLYALTPFTALCGVRPAARTIALLDELGATELASVVASDGPGAALEGLYRGALDPRPAIAACEHSQRIEAVWVRTLHVLYPNEASVAATLLLNLVELDPGEVIRLDAGNLHAYLTGSGIELMAASDNVIRGGLTVKHVDIDELLRVVDPTPLEEPKIADDAGTFALPTAGVGLTRLDPGPVHVARDHELAVDLAGGTWWYSPGDEVTVEVTTFVAGPLAPLSGRA